MERDGEMRRIHIVGAKNHGKTTLLLELIDAARRRGLRVGAIKHTRHPHDVDRPGTDSDRLRHAGALPAAFIADAWMGVFLPTGGGPCYRQLEALYADCDLVLVEGDLATAGTAIEVWRAALGTPPVAGDRGGITAVVTDDPLDLDLPVLPRADPDRLLDLLLDLAGLLEASSVRAEATATSIASGPRAAVRPR